MYLIIHQFTVQNEEKKSRSQQRLESTSQKISSNTLEASGPTTNDYRMYLSFLFDSKA